MVQLLLDPLRSGSFKEILAAHVVIIILLWMISPLSSIFIRRGMIIAFLRLLWICRRYFTYSSFLRCVRSGTLLLLKLFVDVLQVNGNLWFLLRLFRFLDTWIIALTYWRGIRLVIWNLLREHLRHLRRHLGQRSLIVAWELWRIRREGLSFKTKELRLRRLYLRLLLLRREQRR